LVDSKTIEKGKNNLMAIEAHLSMFDSLAKTWKNDLIDPSGDPAIREYTYRHI
jgi:hypothetical protein